ncbi:MAG: methyltransferase domain-containing protein [Chlorobi bacterium]|nr:methyltransferase domain-containing protein [Chlorobiota bacterium]
MEKLYPDSEVELTPFTAKHYDKLLNVATLGFYRGFIRRAIAAMQIGPDDQILDMGCGTGRNACLMYKYLKTGKVTGLDISEIMEKQFIRKCVGPKGAEFSRQRIDIPFDLDRKFDRVFISFVLHGFPHEIRGIVINNAAGHLKENGVFHILDYAEFDLEAAPAYARIPFKKIECPYAFDYIEKEWKEILKKSGFREFEEQYFMKGYVRLLSARL